MSVLPIAPLIFSTVPQYYTASKGPHRIDVDGCEGEQTIFSPLPPSEALNQYLKEAIATWDRVGSMMNHKISQVIEREWIQQKLAVNWLTSQTAISNWEFILDEFRDLFYRTTENKRLSKSILIETSDAEPGAPLLTSPQYHKVFSWLGSTNFTYLRTDQHLRVKSLETVSLSHLEDLSGYRFYPDYLYPLVDSLQNNTVLLHLSSQGNLLIANESGALASKRLGENWTIYDRKHLIQSLAETMKQHFPEITQDPGCVACSVLQIIFDMSFKRQGGLVILDRPENANNYVVRGIDKSIESPLARLFTHSPMNGLEYSVSETRKLVELSAVDGALILDPQGNLLHAGAMVVPHPDVVNQFGMREAAAYSAAKYGALAFKVSTDGDISIFFTTPDYTDGQVHQMSFG